MVIADLLRFALFVSIPIVGTPALAAHRDAARRDAQPVLDPGQGGVGPQPGRRRPRVGQPGLAWSRPTAPRRSPRSSTACWACSTPASACPRPTSRSTPTPARSCSPRVQVARITEIPAPERGRARAGPAVGASRASARGCSSPAAAGSCGACSSPCSAPSPPPAPWSPTASCSPPPSCGGGDAAFALLFGTVFVGHRARGGGRAAAARRPVPPSRARPGHLHRGRLPGLHRRRARAGPRGRRHAAAGCLRRPGLRPRADPARRRGRGRGARAARSGWSTR